jgi:GAG-pre-integrase domain
VEETADSDEETLMAMNTESSNIANADQFLIDPNYNYDVNFASPAYNEDARMYDWLADSRLTNHIACWRNLFSSYEQTPDTTVHGVGGKIIQVAGRETVSLTAQYGSQKRILHLENVNYILSNKYNIFALGKWDSQGCRYQACNGELILFNRQNVPVLKGQKINSNIYKFNLVPCDTSHSTNNKIYTFTTNKPKQPWEIWHHRFGHISYGGLKKLYQEH